MPCKEKKKVTKRTRPKKRIPPALAEYEQYNNLAGLYISMQKLKDAKDLLELQIIEKYGRKSISTELGTLVLKERKRHKIVNKQDIIDEIGEAKYIATANISYRNLKKIMDKDLLDALVEEGTIVLTSSKKVYKLS